VGSSQICWGPNRRRSPGWKRSCNLSGSGWGSALWVPDLSRLCEPSLDCPAQLGAQLHRLLSDVCFHLVRSPTFAARCVCPVLGGSRCRRKFYCSLPLDGYLLQPEPSEHHKFVILYSLTGFLASLFYYLAPLSSDVKMEVLMIAPGIGCGARCLGSVCAVPCGLGTDTSHWGGGRTLSPQQRHRKSSQHRFDGVWEFASRPRNSQRWKSWLHGQPARSVFCGHYFKKTHTLN